MAGENGEMRSHVGKKDENERYKPIMIFLRATGWIWDGKLIDQEKSFYEDNEVSEISETQDIQGILFSENYNHSIVIQI